MKTIYVDELPKSCKQCPYYEINSYADILGYKTNSHKCVLNGSMITGDCPLKPLTDRLAEERKKVVDLVMDNYNNYVGYEMDWIGFHEFLDKIKSGTDTNVDTKNN